MVSYIVVALPTRGTLVRIVADRDLHLGQNGIRDALKDAHIWSTMIPIQSLTYVPLVVPLFTFHTIV